MAALRAELSGMKVRALTRRAEEIGVDDEKLDEASVCSGILMLRVDIQRTNEILRCL